MTPPSSKQPSARNAPSAPDAEPGFEECLEQVESIIDRIERGEVGLEKSLVEYERGVELIRRCRAVLKRAEQRVEDLTDRMLAADDPVSAPPEHGGGGSGEGGAETPD